MREDRGGAHGVQAVSWKWILARDGGGYRNVTDVSGNVNLGFNFRVEDDEWRR